MPKEVAQLVEETIKNLKTKLTNEKPGTKEKANEIIKECLETAFSEVAEDDHKTLYKKLALQFHPDRMKDNQKEIFAILEALEIADAPMKELGNYQEKKANLFEDVAANPYTGTKNVLLYLWEKLAEMFNAYERYPQPLRLMVEILHWTVTIVLLAALIGAAITLAGIYYGIIWPVIELEKLFVNLVTDSRFDEEMKADPEDYANARKIFLDTYRAMFKLMDPLQEDRINAMNDEEFYNTLLTSFYQKKLQDRYPNGNQTKAEEDRLYAETKAELEESIKSSISGPTGFGKLAAQARALGNAIASPLPDEAGAAAVQVMFVKPLQVLITPIVLIASLLIETARYLYTATIFIAIGAALALKLASVVILNLPLYTADGIEYLINACSEGCTLDGCADSCTDSVHDVPQEKPDLLGSPMKGLFGSKHGSEALLGSSKPEPKEQGSYVKLLSLPSSKIVEADTKQELPQAAM